MCGKARLENKKPLSSNVWSAIELLGYGEQPTDLAVCGSLTTRQPTKAEGRTIRTIAKCFIVVAIAGRYIFQTDYKPYFRICQTPKSLF